MQEPLIKRPPPKSEEELVLRCKQVEGLSFAKLAAECKLSIPAEVLERKGWAGQLLELALGTSAGTKAEPDFLELGIELKTIPINLAGKPAESTFVCSIPLLSVHKESWFTSVCYSKLKRVLWVPVEGDSSIPYKARRIGQAILWSPSKEDEAILKADWQELTLMIGTGKLEEIDASLGRYLQVRPKAANSKALCYGYDEEGNTILTLPRGFYLRSSFTAKILS